MPAPDQASSPERGGLPTWATVLITVALGAAAGVIALLWQGWFTVLPSGVVLPWGGLLGALVVFLAAYAWGVRTGARWVPGVTGLLAFAVLGAVSMGGNDRFMPQLNSYYLHAAPGSSWSAITVIAGTFLATLLALILVARAVPPLPRRTRG